MSNHSLWNYQVLGLWMTFSGETRLLLFWTEDWLQQIYIVCITVELVPIKNNRKSFYCLIKGSNELIAFICKVENCIHFISNECTEQQICINKWPHTLSPSPATWRLCKQVNNQLSPCKIRKRFTNRSSCEKILELYYTTLQMVSQETIVLFTPCQQFSTVDITLWKSIDLNKLLAPVAQHVVNQHGAGNKRKI